MEKKLQRVIAGILLTVMPENISLVRLAAWYYWLLHPRVSSKSM
jgi:hypothetical protein